MPGKGCLQRSIAATLYWRAHGTWPTWCTGVRTNPFGAHAWIQVGDQPIGEPHPADPSSPSHPLTDGCELAQPDLWESEQEYTPGSRHVA
ncbi:MAG: lasso peptide biosynthesis B2 protein [Pseudonocardiales bacterium]